MTAAAKPPATLAEALALLQADLPHVAKDQEATVTSQRTGKTHRYKYVDLTDVSDAILPRMAALGLSFTARPTYYGGDHPRFVLLYSLMHTSDQELSGEYPLPATGSPQEIGTAITYARRYALCAVTGLAPGGDDDDGKQATEAHEKRSRTVPDAQLEQQGRMTRQQAKEHDKLAADTRRQPKRAERSHPRGPDPDDPWAQDAPVNGQRAEQMRTSLPEQSPGSILPAQHRAIEMLLTKLQVPREDRVGRHAVIMSALDLPAMPEDANGNPTMLALNYEQAAAAIKYLSDELEAEKVSP